MLPVEQRAQLNPNMMSKQLALAFFAVCLCAVAAASLLLMPLSLSPTDDSRIGVLTSAGTRRSRYETRAPNTIIAFLHLQ